MAHTDIYFNRDHSNTADGTSESTGWQIEGDLRSDLDTKIAAASDGDSITVWWKRSAALQSYTGTFTNMDSVVNTVAPKLVTIVHEGYNVTPGDGADSFDNWVQLTTRMEFSRCAVRFFDVRYTGASSGNCMTMTDGIIESCYLVATNTSTSSSSVNAVTLSASALSNCYVETNGTGSGTADGDAIRSTGYCAVQGCVVRGHCDFTIRYQGFAIADTLFIGGRAGSYSATDLEPTYGLVNLNGEIDPRGFMFRGCTVVDSAGDGISFDDSLDDNADLTSYISFHDVLVSGCAGYAWANRQATNTTTMPITLINCWAGNNTSGNIEPGVFNDTWGTINTFTGDPFEDSASLDYRLDESTTPGSTIAAGRAEQWSDYGFEEPNRIAGCYPRRLVLTATEAASVPSTMMAFLMQRIKKRNINPKQIKKHQPRKIKARRR